jgi:very-short-patch-repair endonuclease
MDAKGSEPPLDQRISELAGRQHGVVARRQLDALGVGRGAIARRVECSRLHRIHRGVYAVGHRVLTRNGTLMAAVLACGEGALLSHRSAAELWRVGPRAAYLDVTVPSSRRRPRIVIHTSLDVDMTTLHGIPLTTPARTLIDLADLLTLRGLERAIDEAEYHRLDLTGLEPLPGRRGAGALQAVLAEHRAGSTRTRTELEELFLAHCSKYGLARPEVNVHVEGRERDFLWRAQRLVVEVDGGRSHRTRKGFEEDRARDAELVAAGYRVMRFTHKRLEREPGAVADQLRRAGAPGARGPRSRSRAARPRRPRP